MSFDPLFCGFPQAFLSSSDGSDFALVSFPLARRAHGPSVPPLLSAPRLEFFSLQQMMLFPGRRILMFRLCEISKFFFPPPLPLPPSGNLLASVPGIGKWALPLYEYGKLPPPASFLRSRSPFLTGLLFARTRDVHTSLLFQWAEPLVWKTAIDPPFRRHCLQEDESFPPFPFQIACGSLLKQRDLLDVLKGCPFPFCVL